MAKIKKTDSPVYEKDILHPQLYFPTTVYSIKKIDFLDVVTSASNDALDLVKKDIQVNETYPVIMSGSMSGDPRLKDFEQYIAQSGWLILESQGYDVDNIGTIISELWCQEHFKYSGMEQHVHPHGVLLSGFYFLETPENGSMIQIYDPRPGKVQASLPEKNNKIITDSSNTILIKPEPGMLVISNSWLPHSFTRNASDKACKFIHFNISIINTYTENTGPIII